MKNKLKAFCTTIGIDCVGIAPIGPYIELGTTLAKRLALHQHTEFDEQDLAKRIDPSLTLPNVKSIIVCLFPYYIGNCQTANLPKYTYATDYHKVTISKLTQIAHYLKSLLKDFEHQAFADTGPLVDRYLAYLAGLGFYGLNSQLINDKYGSYFFVGYLLNNYPFEPDRPLARTCLKCGRCLAACPGKIIQGDFTIDPRGCKSYLTQKKGNLSDYEINILKKSQLVFGCDICQDVCPHNQNAQQTKIAEFRTNLVHKLDYEELAAMSNKEFTRRYGNHAFSWRGKKILLRNLEYCSDLEKPE
ncbi:Epoxyqueuosine reductase [bioreactor metagenome]|uniref:Epoxyqueuosine reductase n=1 Tax=bioreactor metagenome TaxID=1076179 RepID=A0A644U842_9ZZZZ|nr:tRNA epoxyqueuosine(34) reductase QueG [Negativicutes bacterium]